MVNQLWRLSALEVINLLKKREIEPSEAIDAAANRIEETNPSVNSMVTQCIDRAYAKAKELTERGVPDRPGPGYLFGLPISIKDLEDVAGVRSTYGSPIFANHKPSTSSLTVQHLENQGGIIIGKTNTPEFGAGANTYNKVFGSTRNPWDTRKNCGGSSGGAAVGLATGQSWLATGSDLGGSLRIPAAYNSVVGLRPSPGRCSRSGGATQFSPLSVCGPMARNVPDTSLMLDAMAGWNQRDPLSIPSPLVSFQSSTLQKIPPKRIVWSPDLGIAPVEQEVASVCLDSLSCFENLGTLINDEDCPDLTESQELFQQLRAEHFVISKQGFLNTHKKELGSNVIWNIEKGLELDMSDTARAHETRALLFQRMCDFFDVYDLLVTPTVMSEPRGVETLFIEEVNGIRFDNYVDWLMHTYAITLTTCPAISIPCGFTKSGLPVGLQLVGPPRGEANLLSAAAAFEESIGLFTKVPIDPIVRH